MIQTDKIVEQFSGHIYLDEVSQNMYQIKGPFYHEDGDMMEVFLKSEGDSLLLCDFGLTLMRLTYTFDIDTDNKEKILNKVASDNGITNDKGNLVLKTSYEKIFDDLMQYQLAVSKISNLDILKREQISNLFFEYLSNYINENLAKKYHKIENNYHPTNEEYHVADYAILDNPNRPVYILGIKDNLQASRASGLCLKLQTLNKPYTSIAVHNNPDLLSARDRNALTNAVDKQYTSFSDFKNDAIPFIDRQIA